MATLAAFAALAALAGAAGADTDPAIEKAARERCRKYQVKRRLRATPLATAHDNPRWPSRKMLRSQYAHRALQRPRALHGSANARGRAPSP